jgi:hypothetical protein
MESAGLCMQGLSVPGPGAEIVSGPDGIAIAREYNDRTGRLISDEPERFAASDHLPMRSSSAAAEELATVGSRPELPEADLGERLLSGSLVRRLAAVFQVLRWLNGSKKRPGARPGS